MSTFATVDGVKLHYQLEHSNLKNRAVVFINSLGSDLRIWDEVITRLERPSLRYDKRGHGLSDAPTGPYSITDFANDLLGLLEQLKLERVVLVGVSVGGQIALEFASRFPERVAGAVFCDTGMKIGTAESWNARIAAVRETGLASFRRQSCSAGSGQTFHATKPASCVVIKRCSSVTSAVGYIATCEALRESDLTLAAQTVRQSQVKTLVVCGSEDQSTPVRTEPRTRANAETKLELIEGAGHLPCVDHPEDFAKIIKQFLEEVA